MIGGAESGGSEAGRPRAVAIAFEGAIVGGETIFSAIARATLASYGRRASGDLLAGVSAPSLPSLARKLSGELGEPALVEQIEHRLERQLQAQFSCDAHLLPGAIPLLRRLRPSFPLALTSSIPDHLLTEALEGAGIAGFFEAAVGEGSLRAGPPAPAVHHEAARLLGMDAERVLAIEASEAGAIAARAAGMKVVGAVAATAAAARGPLDFDQLMRHLAPGGLGGSMQTEKVGPPGWPRR